MLILFFDSRELEMFSLGNNLKKLCVGRNIESEDFFFFFFLSFVHAGGGD